MQASADRSLWANGLNKAPDPIDLLKGPKSDWGQAMRKLIVAGVATLLSALLSAAALAAIADTNFTPKQNGQPIANAAVTLVATDAPRPAATARPRVQRVQARSSRIGQVRARIPDARPDQTYQVIVTKDGMTWQSGTLTLDQLTSGRDIDVTRTSSPGSPTGPTTTFIPGIPGLPFGDPSGGFFAITGGYASTAPPRISSGVVIQGGTIDRPLQWSPRNLSGPTVNGFGMFGGFFAEFGYSDYDGSTSGAEPVGGNPVGTFYHRQTNGSNGVGLGNTGLGSQIDSSIQRFNIGAGTMIPMDWRAQIGDVPVRAAGKLGAVYSSSDVTHETRETSLTFANIFSTERYEIEQNFIAPFIGGDLLFGEYGTRGPFGYLGARFAPGYTWADLTAHQHNVCNLCPAAQQNFNLISKFDRDGFAWMGNAFLGAGYQFNASASLLLSARYNYMSKSYSFTTPFTASQVPLATRSDDEHSWSFGGTLMVRSDIRLKRDIVKVGHLIEGIDLYRYRYIGGEQLYVGVMAQEVADVDPDAVLLGPDGYLRVNYGRLGLHLQTWDEWIRIREFVGRARE
jgi:Chaperone of endosialidase